MSHQSSFKFIAVLTYCRRPIRHRARSISAITDKSKLGDQYGRKIKPFKSDFLRKSDLPDLAPSPNNVFYMSNRRFLRADLKSGLRNVIRECVRAVRASEVGKTALF